MQKYICSWKMSLLFGDRRDRFWRFECGLVDGLKRNIRDGKQLFLHLPNNLDVLRRDHLSVEVFELFYRWRGHYRPHHHDHYTPSANG